MKRDGSKKPAFLIRSFYTRLGRNGRKRSGSRREDDVFGTRTARVNILVFFRVTIIVTRGDNYCRISFFISPPHVFK